MAPSGGAGLHLLRLNSAPPHGLLGPHWAAGVPWAYVSWIKVGIFFISFRLYVILYFAEAAHSSTNTDNWHTQEKEREGGVCVATYNAFIIFMFHVFYWQLSRVLLTLLNHGYFLTCILACFIGQSITLLTYLLSQLHYRRRNAAHFFLLIDESTWGHNHRRLALKISISIFSCVKFSWIKKYLFRVQFWKFR